MEGLSPLQTQMVVNWLIDLEDTWLKAEMQSRLEQQDDWDIAVAVGLYARLREDSPRLVQDIVSSLLQGKVESTEDRPRRWSRELEPAQADHLKNLMVERIAQLTEQLKSLEQQLALEQPWWWETCRQLLYERDDLACVQFLLQERGEKEFPELAAFDKAGHAFLASLPWRPEWQDDPRFLRILFWFPDRWWASAGTQRFMVDLGQEVDIEVFQPQQSASTRPPLPVTLLDTVASEDALTRSKTSNGHE